MYLINKNLLLFTLLFATITCSYAQNITISGYVRDFNTKEAIISAAVFESYGKLGTTTNEYGFYSITVPIADTVYLISSRVGYQSEAKKISSKVNIRVDFFLDAKNIEMETVKVTGKKSANVEKPQMGVINIPIQSIKNLPTLGGERDVLKIIQLLPGVQQGSEGTTGFFVRGGNIDQNLVQLDEATVYNPNHLFGLFSSFNINALNNVKLTKGGFPAQFGGRLSSILEITMKEGNKKHFQAEGGIGLLAANLTLQGPFAKGKGSYIISGRRSYVDLILKPFTPSSKKGTTYYLYDINAKANYDLNKNNRIFLSIFQGKDVAAYTGANSLNYGINFGNSTATFRWNHIFGSKLFSNTSLIYNDYHLGLSSTQGGYYALLYTGIKDYSLKSDFTFFPNSKHEIKFGGVFINHTLYPAAASASIPKKGNKITINRADIAKKYSNELTFYINEEWKINKKIAISTGLRVPTFISSDKIYTKLEPRITTKYSFNKNTSIKASYTIMNQFLHLIPNSTASLPTDIWLSSSNLVKPQSSTQYALGLFKNFKDNGWETSVEVYYKDMKNQVLFKEGTQIVISTNLEDIVTFGKGKSYGVEFFVKKNIGKFTGWASYTLSKTTQQFQNLNFGNPFPFTYDRRHNLALAGTYEFNKKWSVSANFIFYTGSAFTLPSGRIPVAANGTLYDGIYYDYTSRNNARLRSYNRFDISFSYKKSRKIFGKKYESELAFGAYNVYSRQNPYFIYLTVDPVSRQPQAKQVSLLPIIPSISYNFKF